MKRSLLLLFLNLFVAGAAADVNAQTVVGPDAGSDKPFVIDNVGELETTFRAIGSRSTRSKPSRWAAELDVLVHLKDIASDDALLMTVKRKGRTVSKATPCKPIEIFAGHNMALFQCRSAERRDYDKHLSSVGSHSLELTYRRVVEGTEYKKFAVMNVEVDRLKQGSKNRPYVAWAANHDIKLAVTTIEEKTQNSSSRANANVHNALDAATRKRSVPYLALRTWFKREKGMEGSKVTCFFGKKRVAEANASSSKTFSTWSHGKRERVFQTWSQETYLLYALHPNAGPKGEKGSWASPQHWMNENPGAYKCVITGNGEILKTIRFSVGSDGEIVKPACQLKSFNALRSVTLVTAENKRLVVGKANLKRGKKWAFEGRIKWAKGCPTSYSR